MNYYIKLIINIKGNTKLIYGFCVPTDQSAIQWKTVRTEQKSIVCCYSVVDEKDKNDFIHSITNSIKYEVDKYDIVLNLQHSNPVINTASPGLIKTAPVDQTFYCTTYWQTDKKAVLESIMGCFEYQNAAVEYCKVTHLLDVVKEECGIDFRKSGDRIGNIEFFEPLKYHNSFRVNCNRHSLNIEKVEEISEDLTVNCEIIHYEHIVRNELKVIKGLQDKLVFESNDDISATKINIWDSKGILVYRFYMDYISNLSMNIWTTGKRDVEDKWTRKLRKSSQHIADRIDKIEQIQMISAYQSNVISNNAPFWYQPYRLGRRLFSFFDGTAKGCFVPKVSDKSGEIDSFIRIREYIEDKEIKSVVLADPYFTVESIERLLIRIGDTQANVKIITSLPPKETDGQEKISELKEFTECLKKNANLIYRNCEVINVYRGDNRAFHDRYLIRYYKNGNIDGFMLSNSLNSAGQRFPFAVAPLDNVVLYAVEEYLYRITNIEYQKNFLKQERISIQELFPTDIQTPALLESVDNNNNKPWFPMFLGSEDDLSSALRICAEKGYILYENLERLIYTTNDRMWEQIVRGIEERWDEDPKKALFALGDALYHSRNYCVDLTPIINNYPGFSEKVKSQIAEDAPDMENRHNHKNIYSDEYYYWALLNKQAKAVSAFRNTHIDKRVCYHRGDGFWDCLYRLLYNLDFKCYLELMEQVKSPLMLSIIYAMSAQSRFDKSVYCELVGSSWNFLHELGAKILYDTQDADIILSTIRQQNNKTQLEQSVYILSEIVFSRPLNMEEKKIEDLFSAFVDIIVRICNKSLIPYDDQHRILDHLRVNEKKTNAFLQQFVAERLDEPYLRNLLIDKAIKQFSDYISNKYICLSYKNDCKYFCDILNCLVLRYPENLDKQLLHWDLLDACYDPCLRNYNHHKWVEAYNILNADMILLDMLNKQKPLNEKLLQYYEKICKILS